MSDIGRYLQQHTETIVPLYKDYSARYWDLSLDGNNKEFERALVDAKQRYLHVYNNRDEFRQLQEWRTASATLQPEEARQYKLVYDSFVPNQIPAEVLRDIIEKETEIENLFNT